MSKLILKPRNRVTVRIAAVDVPIHMCLETLGRIDSLQHYKDKLAIEVGGVLFVKDAP